MTPFGRGPLRSTVPPSRWMTGAVHDAEGRLVPESQRVWAGDPRVPIAADRPYRAPPRHPVQLSGTWIYAGHWFGHFGHFFLETLANLWPDPSRAPFTGIVAHRTYLGPPPRRRGPGVVDGDPSAAQRSLLRLAGYPDLDVRIVRHAPARAERLLVPAQAVVLKAWAHPRAAELWQRAASAVEPGEHRRVLLSRRLFHQEKGNDSPNTRATRAWDVTLERAFTRAGFAVVHPETLPIERQVSLVRGAEVLAGSSGSALHLAAFARPGTRVLEVGDSRSPTEPMPTQRVVDAALGHRTTFVDHEDARGLRRVLRGL